MLDPRTRLALLLLGIMGLAATRHPWPLAGALLTAWGTAVCFGAVGRLTRVLRSAAPLAVLVFVLSALGTDRALALAAVLRLLAIISWSVLVFGSTTPHELGGALASGGVPFAVAFVIMTGMQFVPVIGRRAAAVRDAQRARGIAIDTPFGSLRHAPALLLPLLYQGFKLADELAEALETRGFSRPGRTQRRRYRLRATDWTVLALAAALTLGYLALGGL